MHQLKINVMVQKTTFIKNFIGDFNVEVGRKIFSNQHLGVKGYVKLVTVMVLH
jgi:hypothetical protein